MKLYGSLLALPLAATSPFVTFLLLFFFVLVASPLVTSFLDVNLAVEEIVGEKSVGTNATAGASKERSAIARVINMVVWRLNAPVKVIYICLQGTINVIPIEVCNIPFSSCFAFGEILPPPVGVKHVDS